MKANLKVSEIARAVKLCVEAIDPKDIIRSNICFEAENDEMKVTATNGSYSIEIVCPCDVKEEGMATVDGKMAYSILAKASSECSFVSNDKSMQIITNGKTKLPNIGKGLPMIDKTDGKCVVVDSVEFRNAIGKIAYAISVDQSRLILTGAHIVSYGEKMTITSLDGFRLAQTKIASKGDAVDIVVPYKILLAICNAITDGELIIHSDGIHFTAECANFVINSVILSGNYIDTEKIIPTSFTTNVLVNTAKIKECIDSATVASSMSNLVKLMIQDDKILVSSNSEDAEFQGEIEAVKTGNDITIAFNLKYLIQTFAHIDTEQCELNMSSPVSPVIIVPHGTEDDLHLILPVRVFN